MKHMGIHKNGDFGNTVMNGFWDDTVNWVKDTFIDPTTQTNQAEAEKAQLAVTREKIFLYGGLALAGVLVYLMLKKNKVL